MNRKKTLLISLLILVGAIVVTTAIFWSEPTAEKTGASKETAMLVNVRKVHKGTFAPVFKATGIVRPAEDVVISPRVSGEIIDRSKNFIPGAIVEKGEELVQIDPADFQNALAMRQSDLMDAQSQYSLEKGRQDVAQQDYDLLGDSLTGLSKELALRKPQLKAAESALKAAQASVKQARLNLERTSVKAPFKAQIIRRDVNRGSQVAVGDDMGWLVGVEEYWVIATIPLAKVKWLAFPESESDKGAHAKIIDTKSWSDSLFRTGYVSKFIGSLDDRTRMARIIVTVPDPLALGSDRKEKPKMVVNSFVETHLHADSIRDVFRIDRDLVRKDNTIWLMRDGRLVINKVDIELEDANYIYVKGGLKEGDDVVTTNLATVAQGAALRVEGETEKSGGQE
jgi:RND family efflux transporter MFP subunit